MLAVHGLRTLFDDCKCNCNGVPDSQDVTSGTSADLNANGQPEPPARQIVLPGDTWSFQGWYRDTNPAGTSNSTDGIVVLFD